MRMWHVHVACAHGTHVCRCYVQVHDALPLVRALGSDPLCQCTRAAPVEARRCASARVATPRVASQAWQPSRLDGSIVPPLRLGDKVGDNGARIRPRARVRVGWWGEHAEAGNVDEVRRQRAPPDISEERAAVPVHHDAQKRKRAPGELV